MQHIIHCRGGPNGCAKYALAYLKFQPKAQEKKFIAQLSGYGASSAFLAAASSAIRGVSGSPRDWREASASGARRRLRPRRSALRGSTRLPDTATPDTLQQASSRICIDVEARRRCLAWLCCAGGAATLPSRRRHKHDLFPPRVHPSRLELRI